MSRLAAVLAVDAGTSGVRAAVITADGEVATSVYRQVLPTTPLPNFVEFDAAELAEAALEVALEALARWDAPVTGVGITNQRASTICWERSTGTPVGPGVGWQDLRTVGTCLALQAQGLRIAPNASATKLAFLLDLADPDRSRAAAGELAFGTVDTWLAWTLSGGMVHATDPGNAGVTGMVALDPLGPGSGVSPMEWDAGVLEALRIPEAVLPPIVDSSGICGAAKALPGEPPIAGLAGDQQASLLGQGCVRPGEAKLTLGTGGMLDVCTGTTGPRWATRGPAGTIPIAAWRRAGVMTWGAEAIAITAGTAVEWLRDGLGIVPDSAATEALAASVPDSGGVVFVPAFLGLGTPDWDYGARGGFFGLSLGTGRAEITRAVLEGVAHRGADLLEAAEADTGLAVDRLRIDGGMSANGVVLQALADATGRRVEASAVTEATTLGAAFLAGLATGVWTDEAACADLLQPRAVVVPAGSEASRSDARARWRAAVDACREWVPELSAIKF
ncbi:MAG: FGGY family carbohydrate kinase [Acidimicrobiia bacterium]